MRQKDGYVYPPAFGSPGLLRPADARSRHTFDTVWLAFRHYHEDPHCSTLLRFEYHRLAHNFLATHRYYCLAHSEPATEPARWGAPPDRKPMYMFTVNPVDFSVCERELDDGFKITPGNISADKLASLHENIDWLYSIGWWNRHPADLADLDTALAHLLGQQAQILGCKKALA